MEGGRKGGDVVEGALSSSYVDSSSSMRDKEGGGSGVGGSKRPLIQELS